MLTESRGVLALHGLVTLRDEFIDGRRSTDAGKLTFPMQLVVVICAGIATTLGGMYGITYGLRSDVAVILQRLNDQQRLDDEKAKLLEERFQTLTEALQDQKRRMELQQYEVQRLNETIAGMKKGSGQ